MIMIWITNATITNNNSNTILAVGVRKARHLNIKTKIFDFEALVLIG